MHESHVWKGDTLATKERAHLMVGNKNTPGCEGQAENRERGDLCGGLGQGP